MCQPKSPPKSSLKHQLKHQLKQPSLSLLPLLLLPLLPHLLNRGYTLTYLLTFLLTFIYPSLLPVNLIQGLTVCSGWYASLIYEVSVSKCKDRWTRKRQRTIYVRRIERVLYIADAEFSAETILTRHKHSSLLCFPSLSLVGSRFDTEDTLIYYTKTQLLYSHYSPPLHVPLIA